MDTLQINTNKQQIALGYTEVGHLTVPIITSEELCAYLQTLTKYVEIDNHLFYDLLMDAEPGAVHDKLLEYTVLKVLDYQAKVTENYFHYFAPLALMAIAVHIIMNNMTENGAEHIEMLTGETFCLGCYVESDEGVQQKRMYLVKIAEKKYRIYTEDTDLRTTEEPGVCILTFSQAT